MVDDFVTRCRYFEFLEEWTGLGEKELDFLASYYFPSRSIQTFLALSKDHSSLQFDECIECL